MRTKHYLFHELGVTSESRLGYYLCTVDELFKPPPLRCLLPTDHSKAVILILLFTSCYSK